MNISLKNDFILLANISPMYNLELIRSPRRQAQDLIFFTYKIKFIANNIIKREELDETAYWQDKFFFVDLRTNKSGWAFIKQYKEDKNDSCKSVYILTFFGGYRKADYGKTWVAFREEVDPELIRSQYKPVRFLKFI